MRTPTLQELQWFGALVAIGVGLYTVGKPAIAAATSLLRTLRDQRRARAAGLDRVIEAVPRIEGEVSSIRRRVEAELGPNGGGSMKDQVTIIAARQDAMFDAMPTPAFKADAHGRFVSVNRAFEALTGYPSRDLLAMGWVNLIHQAHVEEFMLAWRHTITDARILRRACVIVTADGTERPVCVDAIPVKAGSRVLEWQGTFEEPEAA